MLPLVFLFSGVYFSLGVMTYWLVSNFWTMGQQFVVIRNMPTPGSDAAKARDARLAKKRERKGIVLIEDDGAEEEAEEPKQRQQPVSKDRAKKKKKKRK
jgi:YidC/Oxa1 family membrane protein insertase